MTQKIENELSETLAEKISGRKKILSFRAEMVDVLEHTYGPILLSAAFAYFLAFSDPAHEVILAFADDVLSLWHTKWRVGLLILGMVVYFGFLFWMIKKLISNRLIHLSVLGLFFSLGIFYLPLSGDITRYELVQRFLTWSIDLACSLIHDAPVCEEDPAKLEAQSEAQSDDFVGTFGPSLRVVFGVAIFICVPIAFLESVRLGLYARLKREPLSKNAFQNFSTEGPGVFVMNTVGIMPLIGASYGMFVVAQGQEGSPQQDAALYIFAGFCVIAIAGFVRAVFLTNRPVASIEASELRGRLKLLLFGVSAIATFIFVSGLSPAVAELAGPIAIVSSFCIVASGFLAFLTYLSSRLFLERADRKVILAKGQSVPWYDMGQPPLIVTLVLLGIAMTGESGARAMMFLAAALAVTTFLFIRRRAPLVRALLMLSVVFGSLWFVQSRESAICPSLAGCNIMAGTEVTVDPEARGLTTVSTAFDAWVKVNPDIEPIVIAAQGGGLFAGYHAAFDMAQRQDNTFGQPIRFADRIFAISGVSGGSFGSAVFWAIRESRVCEEVQSENPACYTEAVRNILGRDYLSAPLQRMLYLDNIDSLLPWSALVKRPVDRGNLLTERVNNAVNLWLFENGKTSAEDIDLLKTGLRSSWQASGAGPLLFLNTTDLQTGDRVVQSPVRCFVSGCYPSKDGPGRDPRIARVIIANSDGEPRDLTVGEAAVLSARFPIVTPPGRYRECKNEDCEDPVLKQVADGGYFDNTGLETVTDILSGIADANTQRTVEVLSYTILTPEKVDPDQGREIMGTLGAPINGVMAATTARRDLTVERFCALWVRNGGHKDLEVSASLAQMNLADEDSTHNFTLSWLIGRSSFENIAEEINDTLHDESPELCS